MNKVSSRCLGAVHVLNDVITLHTQQILAVCKQTPTKSCVTCIAVCCDNNNNNQNECQPGLRACGASLSSPGRLVLSDKGEKQPDKEYWTEPHCLLQVPSERQLDFQSRLFVQSSHDGSVCTKQVLSTVAVQCSMTTTCPDEMPRYDLPF